MLEPHQSQFVVRAETMTGTERRLADERAGLIAWMLWRLGGRAARGGRALLAARGRRVAKADERCAPGTGAVGR